MFKRSLGIAVVLSGLLLAGPALAADPATPAPATTITPAPAPKDPTFGIEAVKTSAPNLPTTVKGVSDVPSLIGLVIQVALSLLGFVFFGLILFAGFNWMTARGEAEKVEKSKNTIIDAIIGLILVLAAYAITNFVFTRFQ